MFDYRFCEKTISCWASPNRYFWDDGISERRRNRAVRYDKMPTCIEAVEQATAWESVRIKKAQNTKTDRRGRKKHIKFIECDPQEHKKNRFWAKYSNSFNIKGPIGKSTESESKLPVSEPFKQSDTRASGSNYINIGCDKCPWGLCETAQSSLLQDPAMINANIIIYYGILLLHNHFDCNHYFGWPSSNQVPPSPAFPSINSSWPVRTAPKICLTMMMRPIGMLAMSSSSNRCTTGMLTTQPLKTCSKSSLRPIWRSWSSDPVKVPLFPICTRMVSKIW